MLKSLKPFIISLHPNISDPCPTMASTETQKLITDTNTHSHTPKTTIFHILSFILQPYQWLKMLSSELNPTFILGVFIVYGLNQGLAGHYFKVVSDFYWKDVQKLQPSSVQLYAGLYYIPWVMKPVWGILTDVFPVKGYKRRPYFVMAGVLGTVCMVIVGLGGKMHVVVALACLIGFTASLAIADVTIDACVATNSIEIRALAPDMQSLCGFFSSAGALVGYASSGLFVHNLGAQRALGALAIPPALLIILGFVIYEARSTSTVVHPEKKVVENLKGAIQGMCRAIKSPRVWKPSLYMYMSLALSISTHEGHFYWYTDAKAGPAFSQEFVGMIYAFGALASIAGVIIYQKTLKHYPFRSLLMYAQVLYGVSGMLDLTFVLRWNLIIGIPDYFFVLLEECATRIVSRIRWMPMIVLSTRLCPTGIEGTFFALLMCIDSLGLLSSKWGGGMVLHILHVTRTDFTNLWLAILIRNILRFSTLALIFLVPQTDQTEMLIPPDIITKSSNVNEDAEGLQLIPTIKNEKTEV